MISGAEDLTVSLGLATSNGPNDARRDKYMMQECLRNAGLNTVKQVGYNLICGHRPDNGLVAL
jgi:hypothetical protein